MKIRNNFIIATALVATISLTSCSSTNTNLAQEGVFIVGMECAYQPFNWTEISSTESNVAIENVNGAYAEGYDVQVAKIIAENLDLELQIKAIEWSGLEAALKSNQIDAIIAGMSPTQERKEHIDFSDGYYQSKHVLLVKKDSIYASATTLDDFNGATIIGQIGTLYATLIPQVVEHGAISGTNLDTIPEIVNAIIKETADVTILEEPVAMGIINQYSELTYVSIENAFEVDEEDITVSIGFRKGFTYIEQINEILASKLTLDKRNELMVNAINMAPTAN